MQALRSLFSPITTHMMAPKSQRNLTPSVVSTRTFSTFSFRPLANRTSASIACSTPIPASLFNRPQHLTMDPMKCQIRHRYHYLRNRTRVKRSILTHKASAEHEITRLTLKGLHRSTILPMQDRLRAMMHLDKMHAYTRGATTELRVRCVETGRGNGVIAPWRISRIVWREAAINGHLAGVRACEYFPWNKAYLEIYKAINMIIKDEENVEMKFCVVRCAQDSCGAFQVNQVC